MESQITINTYIIPSANYTDINYTVVYNNYAIEASNERIQFASTLKEQDPFILSKVEDLKLMLEIKYEDVDLDALVLKLEAEKVYNEKKAQHRDKRYKVTVNYDYLYSVSAYLPLILYCVGKDDIITYTENLESQDENGNIVITPMANICVDWFKPEHWAVIEADPHFTVEDLEDYIVT